MMETQIDLEPIRRYFVGKFQQHGSNPGGVDWNSVDAQEIRFEQILKVCDPARPFSINDWGCGYGALVDYLLRKGWSFQYTGFDVVEAMVAAARENFGYLRNCLFTSDASGLPPADYTVASGIFNIKLDTDDEAWKGYILGVLHRMDKISARGFSFNMLTIYSDSERKRPDLYYADPCFMFDYCCRNFAKNVVLLHDYTLYDFTILVRKA